jgi:hypothetical protein
MVENDDLGDCEGEGMMMYENASWESRLRGCELDSPDS